MAKSALYALIFMIVAACSASKQPEIWQSDEVLLQAWQTQVDRNLEGIHDQQKELNEKFHTLEQLYISLTKDIEGKPALQVQSTVNTEREIPSTNAVSSRHDDFDKIEQTLKSIAQSLEQLGERVYAVELASAKNVQTKIVETLDSQAETSDGSFVETDIPNVPILPSNEGEVLIYGIHLGSYRSREQVPGAWQDLVSSYSEIDQLKAKIYIQNQEGVGTFLRLIAGPFDTNEAATVACGRITQVSADQYCKVSEFQGEDLTL
jgi:small-conductance mechanosensitive channel